MQGVGGLWLMALPPDGDAPAKPGPAIGHVKKTGIEHNVFRCAFGVLRYAFGVNHSEQAAAPRTIPTRSSSRSGAWLDDH